MNTEADVRSTHNSYEAIRQAWLPEIHQADTHAGLQASHHHMLTAVLELSKQEQERARGKAPAPFAFFVMGSAGRMEQASFSDQDHGFVFQGTPVHQSYFLEWGKRISDGLATCGYPYCDGKIMASEPRWCLSESDWIRQIRNWVEEDTWESIRYYTIFLDSRDVLSDGIDFMSFKKRLMQEAAHQHPGIIRRLADNVGHRKKGKGILGQFFTETKGDFRGQLDYRETVLFPFVHAARIFAAHFDIVEADTLGRLHKLTISGLDAENAKECFQEALTFRLRHFSGDSRNAAHFLDPDAWSNEEKKKVKTWMKTGNRILDEAIAFAGRRES